MAVVALGGPAASRGHVAPPRTDFTGLWSNASLTELERPDDFKALTITEAEAAAYDKAHRGKIPDIGSKDNPVGGPESEWWELDVGLARIRGQPRTSWIVAPADGQRPFTAAAQAANKARRATMLTALDGPEARDADERCLGYGGAAHPPAALRLPDGDSIGRWDGATLVIETTNFLREQVRAPNGDPAADMKVVERLTRLSPGEILYAFSVTNPARYSQTWRGEMLLHATKGPIYEYACHEGNYGLRNMLTSARRLEGRTVQDPGQDRGTGSP